MNHHFEKIEYQAENRFPGPVLNLLADAGKVFLYKITQHLIHPYYQKYSGE
jgi:hypothetical protein